MSTANAPARILVDTTVISRMLPVRPEGLTITPTTNTSSVHTMKTLPRDPRQAAADPTLATNVTVTVAALVMVIYRRHRLIVETARTGVATCRRASSTQVVIMPTPRVLLRHRRSPAVLATVETRTTLPPPLPPPQSSPSF